MYEKRSKHVYSSHIRIVALRRFVGKVLLKKKLTIVEVGEKEIRVLTNRLYFLILSLSIFVIEYRTEHMYKFMMFFS